MELPIGELMIKSPIRDLKIYKRKISAHITPQNREVLPVYFPLSSINFLSILRNN
jgi:hypothetical protein